MNDTVLEENDAGLILAAEECPSDKFEGYHSFSQFDDVIIRKLSAHGPVLLRGGRGSGKSALLIESHRRMRASGSAFSIYMSLRYLPLLQSDGPEYIGHFCSLMSRAIADELSAQGQSVEFDFAEDEIALQMSLAKLARALDKRIVILFDDAAHIGREKPLEVFFDLFRTLSSNATSCKASIYPGVTKFGVRFDVFNDSTVIDISRSDVSGGDRYFSDVIKTRYPALANREIFSDRLTPDTFASLLGRAVVGNMRAFILACNRFDGKTRVSIPDVNACMLNMAEDYYWPLMEEVAPKLGVYEPLVEPAIAIFEAIVDHLCRPLRQSGRAIAQDRVTIHRSLVSQFSKVFEILEYLGFTAKREASRGMKSGGRGPVYAVNLCSLLEQVPTKRLTIEMIDEWIEGKPDLAEIHSSAATFGSIALPTLAPDNKLGILAKDVQVLAKSKAYPYGLTEDKIARLKGEGINTIQELAETADTRLLQIDMVGPATVKRMRDVMLQAIWM
ncbi:ATP-binding protein [Mesorhizobium sp. B2-4-9]|uniref:ATP-binding protein n=1 Tax=Mesorhizobium sp. B2-4-9 TaxID=2589940 RepID=UPI001129E5A6|nr:ATP-binding protein [Mesorhizobium sp. B2-4-9]TPL20954.1 ATP-binding protein [Mesorhizobium sp. B2-4-9]